MTGFSCVLLTLQLIYIINFIYIIFVKEEIKMLVLQHVYTFEGKIYITINNLLYNTLKIIIISSMNLNEPDH